MKSVVRSFDSLAETLAFLKVMQQHTRPSYPLFRSNTIFFGQNLLFSRKRHPLRCVCCGVRVIFPHLKRTIGLDLKDDLSDPDYRYRPWCRGAADMHRASRRIVSHNYSIVCCCCCFTTFLLNHNILL
jgi:hypothetical protein